MAHTISTTFAIGEYADPLATEQADCATALSNQGANNYYDTNTINSYQFPSLDTPHDLTNVSRIGDAVITCEIVKLSKLLKYELGNKKRNKKLLKKIYILSLIREYFFTGMVDRTATTTGLHEYRNSTGCTLTTVAEYDYVSNSDQGTTIIREYLKELIKDCNTFKI
jgi:hypothetical protein|tara:strand:- start:357 stop:857 length:501 start_codon:yes stop_codon:yes gene_type:complete